MRETKFAIGEFYHIFNRGTDKRNVFLDAGDINRFLQSMREFNTINPIGSIYENSLRKAKYGHSVSKSGELVNFVCYCLNPNHYHFILTPLLDNGIEKFMHRLGNGYSKHFNSKYLRSGSLFQGKYKAIHISSNEYLLHLSAYINLNIRVHKLPFGHSVSKSSWNEYLNEEGENFVYCKKDIILSQFPNVAEYKRFSEESLHYILERREMKEIKNLLLE